MPSSRPITVPVVVHLLRQLRPRSILDVGIGFGKWGHLFREYTDINESELDPARYQKANWQVRIDGIEGHAAYLTDMHRFLYNEIFVGNASDILPGLGTYDLIFLGDIIEHFEKASGRALLDTALAHAGKAVVVSTPKFETDQPDLCANELERHRSLWSARDFKKWPGAQVHTAGGDTLIAVLPKAGQPALTFTSPRTGGAGARKATRQMRAARTELTRIFGANEPFLLVDEEQVRPLLPHQQAHPFPERDGVYWGTPADGESARQELRRAAASGLQQVAFVWSTFWWLDHYPELREELAERWELTHQSEALRVFRVRE